MASLFGTDGIRGLANLELTPGLTLALAAATPAVVARGNTRPRFLVGKDTRISGDLLEAAAVAGLCSAGADAVLGGVMPTPALAYLVRLGGFDGGIMISASHNPYQYNGLKFFGPDGDKVSDRQQASLEAAVDRGDPEPRSQVVGHATRPPAGSGLERYLEDVIGLIGARLEGMRVVVDCGHGAFHQLAPAALGALGAEVTAINCSPTGTNINQGGAVQPQCLAQAVRAHHAHAGVAFDGDGDRVVLVDERGELIDGDQILAIWAHELARTGLLANNLVVGTVISNGGLERSLRTIGCRLARAPVGDRNVYAAMRRRGAVLGGETCGHVIFSPHLSSADGLLVSATVLAQAARTGQPLSALASVMQRRPQVSANVPAAATADLRSDRVLRGAIRQAEADLGPGGRLVVRASGTEPVIRVTAECDHEARAREVVSSLASIIETHLAAERGPLDVPAAGLVRSH